MKSTFTRKLIAVFIAVNFLSFTAETYAQPSEKADAAVKEHNPNKSEVLDKKVVKETFDKLRRIDDEIAALDADLKQKGFSKKDKPEHQFGSKNTFTDDDGEDIVVELIVQDYGPAKGKDAAALGQVTVSSRGRREVYSFSLLAPDGDIKQALEFTVDQATKVIKANSWWSCMENHLLLVGAGCAMGLVDCWPMSFFWAAYLGCVAAVCGATFIATSACCSCNCNWWCRWIGCCRQ